MIGLEKGSIFQIIDMESKEVMRITPDGRFFVREKEVETPEEIRDIFAAWCKGQLTGEL